VRSYFCPTSPKTHRRPVSRFPQEEEEYAAAITKEFNWGTLRDCDNGATLRTYLSRRLHCDPMRISKKYAGSSVGKSVYFAKDPQKGGGAGGQGAQASSSSASSVSSSAPSAPLLGAGPQQQKWGQESELQRLERNFYEALQVTGPAAASLGGGRKAAGGAAGGGVNVGVSAGVSAGAVGAGVGMGMGMGMGMGVMPSVPVMMNPAQAFQFMSSQAAAMSQGQVVAPFVPNPVSPQQSS